MKKKLLTVALAATMVISSVITSFAATQVYFEDFELGTQGDYTVKGTGTFDADSEEFFGTVYHNGISSSGTYRNNYLLLPSDIFSNVTDTTGVDGVTIGFWAKRASDSANWYVTPHFTAFGSEPSATGNAWPMFAIQKRQVMQINCAGYSDFSAAQNDNDANAESTVYLDDYKWHFVTVTMTETSAKYYVDGNIVNSWTVTGSGNGEVITGLWKAGGELDYICLGGNQAWDWADPDVAMLYDDVSVYAGALTQEEIKSNMSVKTNGLATIGAQTDEETNTKLGFVTAVNDDIDLNNVKEMGVIVKNSATVTEGELVLDNVDPEGNIRKVTTNYVTKIETLDNGRTETMNAFRTVLTNISDETKDYTAVPYVIYEDDTVVYGTGVTRSIEDVK